MRSYGTMNSGNRPHSQAGSDRPPSYDTNQREQNFRWQQENQREQGQSGAYRWNVRGQRNESQRRRQQGRRLIRWLFIIATALFVAIFVLLIPLLRGRPPKVHCYYDDYRKQDICCDDKDYNSEKEYCNAYPPPRCYYDEYRKLDICCDDKDYNSQKKYCNAYPPPHCYYDNYRRLNICCEDKDYNSHKKSCNAYPPPHCYYDYWRDRGICCEGKDYDTRSSTCKGYPPPRCYQDDYRYKRVCCEDKDYDSNGNFCRAYPPPHCYYDDYRRKQICCDDKNYDKDGKFCNGYPPSPPVNRKWFGKPPACASYNCPEGSKLIMYSKFPHLAGKYDGCGSESETDLDTRLHACLARWNAVCWSGRSVLCEAEVNPQNPFGFPK